MCCCLVYGFDVLINVFALRLVIRTALYTVESNFSTIVQPISLLMQMSTTFTSENICSEWMVSYPLLMIALLRCRFWHNVAAYSWGTLQLLCYYAVVLLKYSALLWKVPLPAVCFDAAGKELACWMVCNFKQCQHCLEECVIVAYSSSYLMWMLFFFHREITEYFFCPVK